MNNQMQYARNQEKNPLPPMPVSFAFVFQYIAPFMQSIHELQPWKLAFITRKGVNFIMYIRKCLNNQTPYARNQTDKEKKNPPSHPHLYQLPLFFLCMAPFMQSAHELQPWELAFHTTAPRPTIVRGGVMCMGKHSTQNKESVATFSPAYICSQSSEWRSNQGIAAGLLH